MSTQERDPRSKAKKLSEREVNEILAKQMPGYRVARVRQEQPAADERSARDRRRVDAVSPGLDALRAKYLGSRSETADAAELDAVGATAADTAADDVDVVVVEDARQPADPYGQPRRKSVLISRSRRTVVGAQG